VSLVDTVYPHLNAPHTQISLFWGLVANGLFRYQNFAEYATSDTMAKKPEAVMELLERVWAPAKVSADRERTALEAYAKQHGGPANVEAWDWRYYAEKVA